VAKKIEAVLQGIKPKEIKIKYPNPGYGLSLDFFVSLKPVKRRAHFEANFTRFAEK
jgi:hypothetical protein